MTKRRGKVAKRPWTDADEVALTHMAEEGCSRREIAQALGRTERAVYLRADLLQVKVSLHGRPD